MAAAPKRRVILESPYRGRTPEETELNVAYARACLRDSLLRGEAPIASHLLYTQKGVLDDGDAEERAAGIEAGLAWGVVADATVLYLDRGVSEGMRIGIERATKEGRELLRGRYLGEAWLERHHDVIDSAIARSRLAGMNGDGPGNAAQPDTPEWIEF